MPLFLQDDEDDYDYPHIEHEPATAYSVSPSLAVQPPTVHPSVAVQSPFVQTPAIQPPAIEEALDVGVNPRPVEVLGNHQAVAALAVSEADYLEEFELWMQSSSVKMVT
jgi:hypothetical protein